jgi:hypothetical protein
LTIFHKNCFRKALFNALDKGAALTCPSKYHRCKTYLCTSEVVSFKDIVLYGSHLVFGNLHPFEKIVFLVFKISVGLISLFALLNAYGLGKKIALLEEVNLNIFLSSFTYFCMRTCKNVYTARI